MDKMREQMRKYQERQEMTEVANAGQEDETDRKIAAFKKAKMEFTRRQIARDLKKKPLEGTSGMSAQEITAMSDTPLYKAVEAKDQAEVERILALSTADLDKIECGWVSRVLQTHCA